MFTNSRNFQLSGRDFNHVHGDQITHYHVHSDPILALWKIIEDVDAGHKAEGRQPHPRCHPDTRKEILHRLRKWAYGTNTSQRFFWLSGALGAGKSAIAQKIAEIGEEEGFLAASFFFSQSYSKRNTPTYLFLSIAYDLAQYVPGLRKPIEEVIREKPHILRASLGEQFRHLIVEPLKALHKSERDKGWVIVMDGLDECKVVKDQLRILEIISTVLRMEDIPLRFLICSRPEPFIEEAFHTNNFYASLTCASLDDEVFSSDQDINAFLMDEFKKIRTHPRNRYLEPRLPQPWPPRDVVDAIVQKACGQFIYAATLIRFVDEEGFNPHNQLRIALGHAPISGTHYPFKELDALYLQIFLAQLEVQSKLHDIIWAIVVLPIIDSPLQPTPAIIDALLCTEGEVIPALCGMHSLLKIGDPQSCISPLHSSFTDFLHDPSRSGDYSVGSTPDEGHHHNVYACYLLSSLNHYYQIYGTYNEPLTNEQECVFRTAWGAWGESCWKSTFNNELLSALRGVSFTGLFEFSLNLLITDDSGAWFWVPELQRQSGFLLLCLQKESSEHKDLMHFMDFRKAFCVKVSSDSTAEGVGIIKLLTTIGYALTWATHIRDHQYQTHIEDLRSLLKQHPLFHMQVISLGNSCNCNCTQGLHNSDTGISVSYNIESGIYHIQMAATLNTGLL
ncbi:nwd2 [Moniliophthora roreri]|uniref:Nephrocystin 3-like N-terminal domain-containing protein n=1 Tax=Moniliophthora roreri TaxID=221103 RepID=A0A0W0FWT3_MONRR|nr:nwd2 [Moniliophthora roreri]